MFILEMFHFFNLKINDYLDISRYIWAKGHSKEHSTKYFQ